MLREARRGAYEDPARAMSIHPPAHYKVPSRDADMLARRR